MLILFFYLESESPSNYDWVGKSRINATQVFNKSIPDILMGGQDENHCSPCKMVLLKVGSLDEQHEHHLGTCLKCKFPDSITDPLNPVLWERSLRISPLTSFQVNSDACQSLRITDLILLYFFWRCWKPWWTLLRRLSYFK